VVPFEDKYVVKAMHSEVHFTRFIARRVPKLLASPCRSIRINIIWAETKHRNGTWCTVFSVHLAELYAASQASIPGVPLNCSWINAFFFYQAFTERDS
jgi:hypothetical protein